MAVIMRPKAEKIIPSTKRRGTMSRAQVEGTTPNSGSVASMMSPATRPLVAPQRISPRASSKMVMGVISMASNVPWVESLV